MEKIKIGIADDNREFCITTPSEAKTSSIEVPTPGHISQLRIATPSSTRVNTT